MNKEITTKELLFNLIKKLQREDLKFCFEYEDNKLFLEDKKTNSKIYLFTVKIADDAYIRIFYEDGKI